MPRHIAILSGSRGSGKTTTCQRLIDLACQRGLDCAGILSPARFEGTRKVGIDLLDVRSGQSRPLAEADSQPGELRTMAYRFDLEAIQWGVKLLEAACPCDVLIVDELGPLELERGQGWANALDVLRRGPFRLAVVVVRPALLDTFHRTLRNEPLPSPTQNTRVFTVPIPGTDANDPPHTILSLLSE